MYPTLFFTLRIGIMNGLGKIVDRYASNGKFSLLMNSFVGWCLLYIGNAAYICNFRFKI